MISSADRTIRKKLGRTDDRFRMASSRESHPAGKNFWCRLIPLRPLFGAYVFSPLIRLNIKCGVPKNMSCKSQLIDFRPEKWPSRIKIRLAHFFRHFIKHWLNALRKYALRVLAGSFQPEKPTSWRKILAQAYFFHGVGLKMIEVALKRFIARPVLLLSLQAGSLTDILD